MMTTPAQEVNHVDLANRVCSFERGIRPFVLGTRFSLDADIAHWGNIGIGKRTITGVLRIMGLDQQPHFQTYHRVFNRAVWSALAASRILLALLVQAFAPHGPLVFGLDDTIERRWGARIAARGIYRDPVRSCQSHCVKVSGLRWRCIMLLVPIPWAERVWALPFLSALCPSERYHEKQGKERARNNFPICSTSDGRTVALLVVAIARYDSSSRLALHPARRVQIGKLFRARS
jgi:hypothetical protein